MAPQAEKQLTTQGENTVDPRLLHSNIHPQRTVALSEFYAVLKHHNSGLKNWY
jgi:hypothetical protein